MVATVIMAVAVWSKLRSNDVLKNDQSWKRIDLDLGGRGLGARVSCDAGNPLITYSLNVPKSSVFPTTYVRTTSRWEYLEIFR